MEDKSIMLDQPTQILAFAMLAQYHACRLQLKGLRHSSGRSVIAHVKRTYGFKGNNESVVNQFHEMLVEKGVLSS